MLYTASGCRCLCSVAVRDCWGFPPVVPTAYKIPDLGLTRLDFTDPVPYSPCPLCPSLTPALMTLRDNTCWWSTDDLQCDDPPRDWTMYWRMEITVHGADLVTPKAIVYMNRLHQGTTTTQALYYADVSSWDFFSDLLVTLDPTSMLENYCGNFPGSFTISPQNV